MSFLASIVFPNMQTKVKNLKFWHRNRKRTSITHLEREETKTFHPTTKASIFISKRRRLDFRVQSTILSQEKPTLEFWQILLQTTIAHVFTRCIIVSCYFD